MLARLPGALGAAVFFASLACAQAGPDGHWEGSFTTDNREIGVSLDLSKNDKPVWIASMGIPSEKMTGLVVTNLAVSGSSITFIAVELQMAPFDLTLSPDGRMRGTISTPRGPLPIEFKRTGDARVELIPPSPAVSKEMEGDWDGSLETPNVAFHLVFHFKNQPDHTVTATIDAPNGAGLPLDNVRQTGRKLEFGMKIAGGSFRGNLNDAGTEITGQLTHEGDSRPLTLRKK
ncbi:MAG: hypothetical protein LAQ30_25085 [Acidobacteriia bacterium]|nr:hypothetical protein [Terriglobia bacterium]